MNMLLPARLRRSLIQHGPLKTMGLAARKLVAIVRPGPDYYARDTFDATHGTDTGGLVVPARADVVGNNVDHGIHYRGVDSIDFRGSFTELAGQVARYTFVDLGCGKGRPLILAWQMGFTRIHGVEYATGLARIAQQNCRRCRVPAVVICADATTYGFPAGPLVVFMYNPFREEPMLAVAANLQVHAARYPVHIVYRNPECRAVWQGQDWLEQVRNEKCLAVFRSRA